MYKRYTETKLMRLLGIMEVILPLSELEWERVVSYYNNGYDLSHHRTVDSLQWKFDTLTRNHKDTEVIKKAKRV